MFGISLYAGLLRLNLLEERDMVRLSGVVVACVAAGAFGQDGTIIGGNLRPNELVEMSRTSGSTTSRAPVGV